MLRTGSLALLLFSAGMRLAAAGRITEGSLITADGRAFCPLKHTDVKAQVSGPMARVTVTQEFENTFPEKIEAVYTFPLPAHAAVDDMTMLVGDRTVRGKIKRREEARAIYDAARRAGHVAGLLDQERPNIFTQSVANIVPGAKVKITISYVETLPYEHGTYEFVFPMVVGPRYIPKHGVADAKSISPPVTPEGTRAGHDLSIEVALDAGLPIEALECPTHDTAIQRSGPSHAMIRLKDKAVIPNKDFILRYQVAGRRVQDAVLVHRAEKGGFFTLVLAPPERVAAAEVTPKELVFVLDTSGSMMGFPIEKAKEAMRLALDGLDPRDTFNLITFSGDTHILFPQPVPATPENLRQAKEFLASRSGSGGTEMMKAIRAALAPSDAQSRVRVVCFMTDGEVGNDYEIISEVQKHPNARVFAFGIGSSVNRFLLDSMARYGRGEVEYVGLNDDGSAAARRFYERVRDPLLTDVRIDWGGLPVSDVEPRAIPDLFAAQPVVVAGRYSAPASGVIHLRGQMAGRPYAREIRVDLPAAEPRHDVLATLWARRRVEALSAEDFLGLQRGSMRADLREQITRLGLDFRLMTPFTSLVAVEETTITEGGQPHRIEVPVEMPEGVSYEGVFGSENRLERAALVKAPLRQGGFAGVIGGVISRPAVIYRQTPTDEDSLQAKMHSAIAAVIARAKSHAAPSANESRFVRDGKAAVQVFLADTSPETLRELRQLGFEIVFQPKTGTIVSGRIAVEQLEALVRLEKVRYVAPQW